jgi:hypothetical protein
VLDGEEVTRQRFSGGLKFEVLGGDKRGSVWSPPCVSGLASLYNINNFFFIL